jgi:acetyl-CoA carboxylase/biotin carboxylase 1
MAPAQRNGGSHANGVTVPVMNGHTSYAAKHNLPSHFIGGNRLEVAESSRVKDFVAAYDGHTVITSVSDLIWPNSQRNGR